MKRLLISASVFAVLSASAFAADLAPQAAEPVAPVYVPYNWTGFYVGLQAGYLWGDSTLDGAGSPAGVPYLGSSLDPKGGFGGAYVGYNYQFNGGFVVGAEADFNGSGASSDNNPFALFPIASGKGDLKWFGSARLRVGYAFDRILPFVTAGVAFSKYEAQTNIPVPVADLRQMDLNKAGWTVGAGVEYAFTDNLIGRIEYRYADYGHKTRSGTFLFPTQPARLDLSTNDVRVGLAYKF